MKSELAQLETWLTSAQGELEPVLERLNALEAERNDLKAFINGATLDTDTARLTSAQSRLPLLEREIDRLKPELSSRHNEVQAAQQACDEARSKVAQAHQQLAILADLKSNEVALLRIVNYLNLIEGARVTIERYSGERPEPFTITV